MNSQNCSNIAKSNEGQEGEKVFSKADAFCTSIQIPSMWIVHIIINTQLHTHVLLIVLISDSFPIFWISWRGCKPKYLGCILWKLFFS